MGRFMEDEMADFESVYALRTQEFFGFADIRILGDGDVEISDVDNDIVCMSKGCAIAAARAILKHFNCGMEE